jgi:SAM-dependent methyltransferase
MAVVEDVRTELYARYGAEFQDNEAQINLAAADRWGRAYNWYLRGWLPESRDAAIGEVATGNGKFLHFLKNHGYRQLSGVDISPDQVATARTVVADVAEGDALEWLAGRANRFDLLVALDIVEHFDRAEALLFLDRCLAALKPGGRLILQTPNADSPFGLQLRYGDMTHEWCFNANLLGRLLRRAGFVDIAGRELGPPPWGYSLAASLRWLVWQVARGCIQIVNIAEQGGSQQVLTRVFLMSARKP